MKSKDLLREDTLGYHKDTDEEVEEMITTWDVVTCKECKKSISMLDATLIDESYFVCKKHG